MGNSTGVLDRFYSKLSPFMNPGLHCSRDQQAQRESQKLASGTEQRPASNSDAEGVQGEVLQNASTPDQVLAPAEPATAPKASANEKAFDLFEAGTLSEAALLIALAQPTMAISWKNICACAPSQPLKPVRSLKTLWSNSCPESNQRKKPTGFTLL